VRRWRQATGQPTRSSVPPIDRAEAHSVTVTVPLAVEQTAPEWTAHQQLPRVLVGELMTRGSPSPRLRALADRLHVRPGTRIP
jgi:hypothetical protein